MNAKKLLATIVLLAIVVSGLSFIVRNNRQATESDKLDVVVSYYPLYDFVRQIGGDKVRATNLTPAGSEPHDYEPSPSALVGIRKADVFVYNGGMEPWADKFLDEYRHVAVKTSKGITLLEGDEHGHDPHFWLDPIFAQRIVTNIRDGVIKADPSNKAYYTKNAKAYNDKLAGLDKDFVRGLKACRQDTIISSHNAFSYLALRYGFTVEAIAGISPEQEPSAARLAELSRIVTEKHIGYVFFESLVSPRLADTIAQETGAKTLVFDPIEGLSDEDQKQGKDYLSVQRENLSNLRTALACQ
ncbi:MAG: metal ABC transporter substrate-binding protein [Patescibacteria group bacterium]